MNRRTLEREQRTNQREAKSIQTCDEEISMIIILEEKLKLSKGGVKGHDDDGVD